MSEVPFLFSIGLFFCIAVVLLVRKTLPAFKFMGIGAALLSYISCISFLAVSGKLADWPHLFRTQSPLQYLIGPIGLWTALWLIRPELKWYKLQFFHFVPFLLHALELIPFYALSAEEKVAYYMQYIQVGYNGAGGGIFSFKFHAVCKSVHLLGYTLVWAYLLRKAAARSNMRTLSPLLVWINIDLTLKVLATVAIFSSNLWASREMVFSAFGHGLLFLDAFISALFLFTFPNIVIESLDSSTRGAKSLDREYAAAEAGFLSMAEKWASQVDAVLERHYQDPDLDVDTIAGHMFVSGRHLHRICRQYGIGTPMERLLELRMERGRAQIMADPGKPLTSIALEVGFTNLGYFSLRFKNRYGILPSEFQKQHKNCD